MIFAFIPRLGTTDRRNREGTVVNTLKRIKKRIFPEPHTAIGSFHGKKFEKLGSGKTRDLGRMKSLMIRSVGSYTLAHTHLCTYSCPRAVRTHGHLQVIVFTSHPRRVYLGTSTTVPAVQCHPSLIVCLLGILDVLQCR